VARTSKLAHGAPSPLPPPLLQCSALLVFYGFAPLQAPAVVVGHGVAAQANLAANRAALVAGLSLLGHHLGLRMDDSWERSMERDTRRAFNASATVAAHALYSLGGPAPPFGPPLQFPATADAFRGMALADARVLGNFYALPPHPGLAADAELALRRADIAAHMGFRE
jgi:hypothetical protein